MLRKSLSDIDDNSDSMWDDCAADHTGFRQALETLIREGCKKSCLFDLLGSLYDTGGEGGWSRSSVEETRSGLQQGIDALRTLRTQAERALLKVDTADLIKAQETLTQAAEELRPIERPADARRSFKRDFGKALLVRYVKNVTGHWHDQEVAEILDVALDSLEPLVEPEFNQAGNLVDYRTVEIDYGPLPPYTMEAHRRWRGRNTTLLEFPDLEKRWTKDQPSALDLL